MICRAGVDENESRYASLQEAKKTKEEAQRARNRQAVRNCRKRKREQALKLLVKVEAVGCQFCCLLIELVLLASRRKSKAS